VTVTRFIRRVGMLTAMSALLVPPVLPALADPTPPPTTPKTTATRADLVKIPTVTPAVLALMDKQAKLQKVADDIRAQAPHSADAGLAGVTLDPRHNTVRLFWHGALPDSVTNEIAAARARGITVETHPAPYTEKQLTREVARMSARPLSTGSPTGRRTMQLAPNPDGSGINAVVSGLPSGVTAANAKQMVPALASAIPVTVQTGGAPAFTFRFFDTIPYWGGAFIHNGGTGCSDAFGVTGNNGASTYMFTAAHCGTGTWTTGTVNSGSTTITNTIGSTFSAGRNTGIDVELLLPPSGDTDGNEVYVGAPINPDNNDLGSNTGIPVAGSGSNAVGALVCTDGSFSGTICNVRVQLTNVTITISPAENGVSTITHLVQAMKVPTSGEPLEAVGNGDSGGPVVIIFGNGTARAQGIISAQRNGSGFTEPCVGYTPPGRMCSNTVFYADLNNAMSTVGVHLNTG
jgi:streptogrisin D